ncbi:MAG: 23S rRNA (guanosine(2251)-2'-O)-methyltransferase RlmB [Deltaproteobacteria bacterium]|nr:23S rRNA (guanosine(2251)-2'-O)-methyltransferase RlmB [Deltaproteobacteria bacterium]
MSKRVVYGLKPVHELVRANPRGVNVVYVATGSSRDAARELWDLCRDRGVTFEERDRAELDVLAGPEARHQGVVAIAGEFVHAELEDVLDDVEERGETPLIVVLDSVQDPHNLGAVIRSSHVLGAHAVVIAKDRAAPVTPAAVKASAGATEHIPVARVTNIARTLELLKERGIWAVGTVAAPGPAPWKVDLRGPTALVLGAEGKGLRPLVQKGCDTLVQVPMVGRVSSLNVSVTAGIMLYEVLRQRQGTGTAGN